MPGPADFLIEILPWPYGSAPTGTPVDVTDYVWLEDLGSINRALEQDLL